MLVAILLVAAAASAPAQDFALPEEVGALVLDARGTAARFQQAPPASRAAADKAGDAFARALNENGLWGAGKADALPSEDAAAGMTIMAAAVPAPAKAISPLNQGFIGLGATGKTGTIDGPGLRILPGQRVQGDGTYRVTENDPDQVVLQVQTGYIDGTFTLKRDPATGKDTLGFAGKLWNQDANAWGPAASGANPGQVTYDPASDSGTITWSLGGARHQDKYHGGRAGSRGMTIELTGYGHDFKQN